MYTPLRYQATESDCFPTCVLNALTWLFEREELPGRVLKGIYATSLDGVQRGSAGCYTSERAGLDLARWLSAFNSPGFAVSALALHGDSLTLFEHRTVVSGLRHGAVAILDVIDSRTVTHSMLALSADSSNVYFWDPYLRGAHYRYAGGTQRLKSNGYGPNLRIPLSWLDSTRVHHYGLGPTSRRSAVIIRRKGLPHHRRPPPATSDAVDC